MRGHLLWFLMGLLSAMPNARAGQFELGGAGDGIVLTSPNGTRYKVAVSNLGLLTATAL